MATKMWFQLGTLPYLELQFPTQTLLLVFSGKEQLTNI